MAGRGTDIVLGGKQEEGDQDWEAKHQQVLDAVVFMLLEQKGMNLEELIIS